MPNRPAIRRTAAVAPALMLTTVGLPIGRAAAAPPSDREVPRPPSTVSSPEDLARLQRDRIAALADSRSVASPDLWRGRLFDPSGRPAPGTVVAYLRPGPRRLAALGPAGSAPGTFDVLVPVARTVADPDGTFALRAAYDPSLDGLRDGDGSLVLMIVATSAGATGFAVNTIWWTPGDGTSPGAWLPESPANLAAARADLRGASALGRARTRSAPPRGDLHLKPTRARTVDVARDDPAGTLAIALPGGCIFWNPSTYPDTKAYIGASFAEKTSAWRITFRYENTNKSSFETGWTAGGAFTVAGAVTTTSTTSAGGEGTMASNANSATGHKHWITVRMHRNIWRCWNSPTPPPSPGYWPEYHTLEPGAWVRDFDHDRVTPPACPNPDDGNITSRVGAGKKFWRTTSSSTTITNAISGDLNIGSTKIPFRLGAKVTDTRYSDTSYTYVWHNTSTSSKSLCGLDGPVLGNTRVLALGVR